MVQVAMQLPITLVEQVKAAARRRSIIERRHVPYVELIRAALGEHFPPVPDADGQSQEVSTSEIQERPDA